MLRLSVGLLEVLKIEPAYLDGGDNYPLCINADVSLNQKKAYKLISRDSVVCPEKTDEPENK